MSLEGCFAIPVGLFLYIVKKIWRKLVYVLAIADATALVSAYWQRAYLLDHIITAGHVGPDVDWERSATAFEKVSWRPMPVLSQASRDKRCRASIGCFGF